VRPSSRTPAYCTIDATVERAIGYYLNSQAFLSVVTTDESLQLGAINYFNLTPTQRAEFRLKVYQLNVAALYVETSDSIFEKIEDENQLPY
jgi:hypothetical protein